MKTGHFVRPLRSLTLPLAAIFSMIGFLTAPSALAQDDPPARVARLSYVDGNVSFAPSGDEQWSAGSLNRPISTGDRLATSEGSRAEVEVGGASLQADSQTTLDVANLDDRNAQFELSSGTVNLYVANLNDGENYEVDTPTVAFVASAPGNYRIEVGGDGDGTTIKVNGGAGTVYGENNASYQVGGQQAYQFPNSQLEGVIGRPLFRSDDFDDFAASRNGRFQNQGSQEYVSNDVVGASDLDDNGQWADEPEYGQVWYPSNVDAGWAPYRNGHWVWIDPWGWNWVDDEPWGFAPFHYGRWAYVHERWGWVPGPRRIRPVYSPALVAFVGGGAGISIGIGGGPVGWFPLGPRDVYCPPYRVSQQYFFNANVSNVNDRYIDRGRINDYYDHVQGGRVEGRYGFRPDFAYRNAPNAMTMVSHDTFTGARPVNRGMIPFDPHQVANAPVQFRSPAAPTQASLARQDGGGVRRPPPGIFGRPLVTHAPPPQAPPSFAARQPEIQRNQGQPLAPGQLRQLAPPTHSSGPVHMPFNRDGVQDGAAPQRGFDRGTPATEPSPFDSDARRTLNSQPFRGGMPSTGFSPRGNEARQNRGGDYPAQDQQPFPQRQPDQEQRRIPIIQQPARPDYSSRPQFQERPQQESEQPQYQQRQPIQSPPQVQERPEIQSRPQFQERPQIQERPQVQERQPIQIQPPRPQIQERPLIVERPQPQAAPQMPREQPRPAMPPPQQHVEAPRPQPPPQRPAPRDRDDKR